VPLRVLDLFECWWTAGRSRSTVIWKMVPTCILWCVWKERNDRYFEDLERSSEDILASFFFIRCIFGRWLLCHCCRLPLMNFLFVFHFLARCVLLYTAGVFRGALRF
jgi:hypothetical protein